MPKLDIKVIHMPSPGMTRCITCGEEVPVSEAAMNIPVPNGGGYGLCSQACEEVDFRTAMHEDVPRKLNLYDSLREPVFAICGHCRQPIEGDPPVCQCYDGKKTFHDKNLWDHLK